MPSPFFAADPPAAGPASGTTPAAASTRRIPRWLPPVLWACVVLGASSIQDLQTTTGGIEIRDKLAHFGEYFVFGWLVARAFEEEGWSPRKHLLWTVIFGMGLGMLDEFYQGYVPGRERDVLDLCADTVGAFCGWYFSREEKSVGNAERAPRNA